MNLAIRRVNLIALKDTYEGQIDPLRPLVELLRTQNHLPWVIPVLGHRHFSITFETPENGEDNRKLTPFVGYDFLVCAYYMAFNDNPDRFLPTVDVMIVDESDEATIEIVKEIVAVKDYLGNGKF